MSIFLAWWLVPLTLLLFWVRYLPRHDWMGTTFQVVAWVVAALVGFAFYILMVRTLRRMEISFWRTVGTLGRSTALVLIALIATSMIWMSRETFSGARVDIAGFRTFADLEEKDVSTRPDNWTGEPEQIPLVKAAELRSMDLRNARASGAFLVNADLRGADLGGEVLVGADLRGARLGRASLTGADLAGAQLGGSDVEDADLDGADLSGADLRGTALDAARNLTQAQLDRACGDGSTGLPPGLKIRRCPTDGWLF